MARKFGLTLGVKLKHPRSDEEAEAFQRMMEAIRGTGEIHCLTVETFIGSADRTFPVRFA